MFEAADAGLKDMNFDSVRWESIIENLLINDNLLDTFDKAYTENRNDELTAQGVLNTVMEIMHTSKQ